MIEPGTSDASLFDRITWRDPVTGMVLVPQVVARTPAGVPLSGALRVPGTDVGYPIVDCVARLTPELAHRYKEWLTVLGLRPPDVDRSRGIQMESTVESFGWQWTWNSRMRSDADLHARVVEKFDVPDGYYRDKLVADMGAGAGDQSRYLLDHGAYVVSVDLSAAIEVVAAKLRMNSRWFGVQADITNLPLMADQFDCVYCEGVIQHTQDSLQAVRELARVVKEGGEVLAAHYVLERPRSGWERAKRSLSGGIYRFVRGRLSGLEQFKLLLVTGNLAAMAHVPVLGWFVRKAGLALRYDLMPDFKTTWTNTYDYFGSHSYQRFMTAGEFVSLFREQCSMAISYESVGNVRARKPRSAREPS